MFDRIDVDPTLSLLVIALNFKSILQIKEVICLYTKEEFLKRHFNNPYCLSIPEFDFESEWFRP